MTSFLRLSYWLVTTDTGFFCFAFAAVLLTTGGIILSIGVGP